MLVEIVGCEFTGETTFITNGLTDPLPTQGPGKWVGETVRDRAVVLMEQIVGSNVVISLFRDSEKQQFDPFR